MLDRLRPMGVDVTVGHDAANVGRRRRPRGHLDRGPRRQPRGRRGPARGASRCCAGPSCWPPSPPTRTAVAVAGTHGKTTTVVDAGPGAASRPGCDPSFIIGGDVNELGARRGVGRRRLVRGRGRRERRHRSSTCPARGADRHQRRARPPRALRRGRGRSQAAFDRFLAETDRARVVVCADDPRSRPARRARSAPSPTARAADADYRMVELRGRRATASRFDARGATASALGAGRTLPRAGRCTTPATPRAAAGHRPRARRARSRPPRPRLARFGGVARRFEHRGEAGGRHLRRRLRPPAHRGARPRSPPAATAAGAGSSRVFQPHRYSRTAALWPDFADAFADADLLVAHRHLRRRRGAAPGRHRQAAWSTPCSTPTPRSRSPTCPTLDDVVDYLADASCGPATCASPSAPATSPRVPDRGARPAPGRERPRRREPSAAVVAERRRRARARPPARDAPARRRSPPTGSVARPRCSCGPSRPSDARGASAGSSPRPARTGAGAGGRPGLEPAGGRRGASPAWPSCSATAFAGVEVDGTTVRAPGARPRCRSWPAGPRRAGPDRLRVGGRACPGRSAARCG